MGLILEGSQPLLPAAADATVTSTDITDSTAVGRSVLTAATAAIARAAIGAASSATSIAGLDLSANRSAGDVLAAIGPTRVGIKSLSTSVGPRSTNGPAGVKGWTFVLAFYISTLPGTTPQSLWNCTNGSTRGWGFLISGNSSGGTNESGAAGDNKLSMYLPGTINFDIGAALATGAHTAAFSLDADGLHYGYSIDGAAATTGVSLAASAAAAAQSADIHSLGNWINGFYSATSTELFHLVAINDVADATELAALSASPSDLRIAVPSTLAAADMDLCIADVPGHALIAGWTTVARGTGQRVLVTAGTPAVAIR